LQELNTPQRRCSGLSHRIYRYFPMRPSTSRILFGSFSVLSRLRLRKIPYGRHVRDRVTSRERTSKPRRPGMLPIRWRLVIAPRRERCGTAQSCCWFIRLNSFAAPRAQYLCGGSPRMQYNRLHLQPWRARFGSNIKLNLSPFYRPSPPRPSSIRSRVISSRLPWEPLPLAFSFPFPSLSLITLYFFITYYLLYTSCFLSFITSFFLSSLCICRCYCRRVIISSIILRLFIYLSLSLSLFFLYSLLIS